MTYLIVCGLHRSGTTYVGELLKSAGVTVVHEPLNQRFGMTGVSITYPHVEYRGDPFAQLIDDFVRMSRSWNTDTGFIQTTGIKRSVYGITGGKSGLRWAWLRVRKSIGLPVRSVCFKDPFSSLATPYLVKHHGLRALCLVRHPAAIFYSTEKQNWHFDVLNLCQQTQLLERYGQDIAGDHWAMAEKHGAASIALLWKLMWRINSQLAGRNERLKIITHESLCLRPIEEAQMICDHFGVDFSSKVEAFVFEHSGGDRAEAEHGRTHDFKRDSRSIPDLWRGKLKEKDETMMREIVGQEVITLYGAW